MSDLAVSIVIVSRGRPAELTRCLRGVAQLQYAPYEVVVVADENGAAAARAMEFANHLKIVVCDRANISAARNLGIVQAAGDVVAFIDDDAVPEPQWLRYLAAPARNEKAAAMGGFVRGRNGISYQWRARALDAMGEPFALDLKGDAAVLMTPAEGRAIKTEGTNMAVRRSVLIEIGGFDEAFHYFLDETDLNMRLARAGYATAIVPLAEVHHGFAANAGRTKSRVPTDLYDIGASWAVFQRKHVPVEARALQWQRLRSEQRRRLLEHMVSGGLEPRDLRRLLARLDAGYGAGQTRAFGGARIPAHPASGFRAFPARVRRSVFLTTRPTRVRADARLAAERVARGDIVTLLNLSPTALYHRVFFGDDGIWWQTGGLFGKSDRFQPLFRSITRQRRIQTEIARVRKQRGLKAE